MNKFKSFILSKYYYILYLITPKSKLKVLYGALYKYLYECPVFGMCFCIQYGLCKVYNKEIKYYLLNKYFPEFNRYVAKSFNSKRLIGYWWDLNNIKDRYNYFKWLIKIYKNKKE